MGNTKRRPAPIGRVKPWDELRLEEKFQSSLVIAGSPRNSFRASVLFTNLEVEHWMEQDGFCLLVPTKLRIPNFYDRAVRTARISASLKRETAHDSHLRSLSS